MNQISVTVTGASRVEIAKNLRAFADNLDGTPAGADGQVVAPASTKKPKKTAPVPEPDAFEDDEAPAEEAEVEAAADDDDEDFAAEPPPKKAAKKLTLKEVNAACAAYAKFMKEQGKDGRAAVLKILKAKFKTETISTIKEELYPKVVEAMAVSQ